MIALVLLGWVAGWLLLGNYRYCRLAPGAGKLAAKPSIIIPARNEEQNLPRLLQSIASADEVIVVDDCSADRTREVARAHGARVVVGTPPPPGWFGKTWACQQGANAATGEVLLFLDADTSLEKNAIATMSNEFRGNAISLAPYHCVPTLREQFPAFLNLVMLAGAGPHQLLGQSLLIDRATYKGIGGHAVVRSELMENFALSQKLNHTARGLLGRGVVAMRMYPGGWREMIDGWSKSFAPGAARVSLVRFMLVIVWITGCVLAVMHPLTYATFALQLGFLLRRIGSYRWLTALLYPIPLLFFVFVFARSAFQMHNNERILWKGRVVRAD